MDPFKVLAIAPTDDLRAIKKAYAAKLKQNRPDKNPEGYQYLREAFDLAKTIAQQHAVTSPDQYGPATLDNRITLSPEAAPAMTATAAPPPTSQTVAVTAVSDNADEAADQREPVVVSVCAEEMPDAEPEVPRVAPAELVNSLLSGIHDELVDFGDVAGFSKFLDTWNSETLIPINLSRLFEEHTCEYLTWLLHQVKDGKTDWFPSGFVRQVYRHYGWHQSRHLSEGHQQMLDDLFEAACANSGFAYLQFVANSGAIKEERDRHRKAAACLLVGPLRPLRFRIALAFGNVRRALFELLDEVTDLGDGSLAFELNTPSIAWWRERRDHFHFDVLMMMGALFVALATQALLIDVTTRWTAVAANLGPATLSLSYLLLWLFCCAVVYWCMRGLWRIHLAAAVVRVNLSRHLQQSEWPRVVPALLAIAATQLSYASESLLSIFAFTFSFCLLAWLYRLWVFVFLAGGLLTYVGYEIRLEPGAHKELSIILVTANQVLLHAGIVICVLLVRPHDRTHRDRQSETETVNDSRLDSAQVALLLMLALGSGYAVLPLLR